MPEDTRLMLTIDDDLRTAFFEEAEASQRDAGEIIQELMRHFVEQQREARAYENFLHDKVERARRSVAAGRYRSNDEVEAEFAVRRNSH